MSHLRDVTLTKKDTINLKRKSLLYLLFRDVEVRRHRLENGRITCTFDCDSFRLGALMKQMKAHSLPWPRENLDYKGLAPESVAKKILEFEKPSSKVSCKGRCSGLLGPRVIEELIYHRTKLSGLILIPKQWR
jgi:hypothetical protein